MSLRTMGKVYLNETRFTTDPQIQRSWPPRRSKLAGIMGSSTKQDFGRFAGDMRLTLTGGGNYINQSFKAAVEALMLVRRAVYSYRDYQGIVGTVVIADFTPTPTFIRDGAGVLFEYVLVLDVVTLTKLDFADYTGA